jgi:hypothetical protein
VNTWQFSIAGFKSKNDDPGYLLSLGFEAQTLKIQLWAEIGQPWSALQAKSEQTAPGIN